MPIVPRMMSMQGKAMASYSHLWHPWARGGADPTEQRWHMPPRGSTTLQRIDSCKTRDIEIGGLAPARRSNLQTSRCICM